MEEEEHIPILIKLLYGEQAGLAAQSTSGRLRRWCTAFEAWQGTFPEYRRRRITHPWRELLSSRQKMPWKITEEDVEKYLAGLEQRGYVGRTIHERRRYLERFYDWCGQHGVNEEKGERFNPVKGVPKPKLTKYKKTHILSAAEARQLLAALRKDESILGKRDYAFFLARLLLGVRLKSLLELSWGQVRVEEDEAWVLWRRRKAKPERLPQAVWDAIQAYLEASGRLEGIQPGDYIFAPLADPLGWEGRGTAEEWKVGKAIHVGVMNKHLKRFGRLAGIPEEKLKLTALRHTAAMLRLEAGDDPGQIQEFLGRPSLYETSNYLKRLAEMPASAPGEAPGVGEGRESRAEGGTLPATEREPPHRKPGAKLKHGLYARRQPAEEMAAILAENLQGLEQEIEGLRLLNQGLFEMFDLAETNQERAHLAEVSGRSEARLAEMVRAKKQLAERRRGEDKEAKLRKRLEKLAHDLGSSLEEWDAPGSGEGGTDEMAKSIARLRLGLRRTMTMVLEAQDLKERLRYTDLYGVTCIKLVKLLRVQAMGEDSLAAWWRETIDKALKEAVEEMNLRI
jgi:integrase